MHIPRFFLTENELKAAVRSSGATAALDLTPGTVVVIQQPDIANQVKNVLRLRAGDRVVLLDGNGRLFRCLIEKLEGKTIDCRLETVESATGDPPFDVRIGLALLKGERFEWALQKLTELGVREIVPLATARTVVKFDASDAKGAANKLARWRSIVKEAAEQCERATIPHIVLPKKMEDFMDSLALGGIADTAFICTERLQTTPLKDIFLQYACHKKDLPGTTDRAITLIVGPEGGFTEAEVEDAQNRGVKPVSLGARILRSETAAILSVAQVIWSLEK